MNGVNSWVKAWSIALGIGLIVLWLGGLGSVYAPGWLTWLDGGAALLAFIMAGSPPRAGRDVGAGPLAIAALLGVFWLLSFASVNMVAWLQWWTFAFACAFALVGLAALGRSRRVKRESRAIRNVELLPRAQMGPGPEPIDEPRRKVGNP